MADTPAPSDPGQQQGRQIAIRIDESKMATTYANTIRTSTTPDEVVLDFGINMPMVGPDNQQMLMLALGTRVVMNWQSAKRFAISLGQAIRKYEEANGEIPVSGRPSGGPRLAN